MVIRVKRRAVGGDEVNGMRRRELVFTLTTAAILSPHGAKAQPVRRVVLFTIHEEVSPAGRAILDALRGALRELGWREGKDILIEPVWAGTDTTRFPGLASDLARQPPDVIVSASSAVLRVLRQAVPNVPIVFIAVSNPDGQGFVDSLNRPGGRITGFVHLEYSIGPKWVQLLKEIAPAVTQVLVLFNPDAIPAHEWLPPIQERAKSLGADILTAPVRDPSALESAISEFGRDHGGGLLIMPEAFTALHRKRIIEAAARARIPAIYPWDYFARDGGLVSYGSNFPDLARRAGSYVDRILKGARAGDLPVQQPTKFELIVNSRTARALGLPIPETILLQADEVLD
jgi:putative ABC transport system substrate-binding protein